MAKYISVMREGNARRQAAARTSESPGRKYRPHGQLSDRSIELRCNELCAARTSPTKSPARYFAALLWPMTRRPGQRIFPAPRIQSCIASRQCATTFRPARSFRASAIPPLFKPISFHSIARLLAAGERCSLMPSLVGGNGGIMPLRRDALFGVCPFPIVLFLFPSRAFRHG